MNLTFAKTTTSANILVVDDTPANIRLLAQMLSSLGYKVRKATSGQMALDAVEMVRPDAILLDINMPDMDGYQVCQKLKANPTTCDIPVIFISALDEVTDKLKGFGVGGIDYITKPFQLVEVQARVKTHVSIGLLRRELQLKNQLLEAERVRAGQVQAALFPKVTPELIGFELAARCLPAKEIGGDFYDWQMQDAEHLTLTLGDVMGKGMPAALLTSTVRATLRALGSQPTPAQRIDAAQALLAEDFGHSESFVTLFHGQLNLRDRQLSYIDAGHGLVFLKRANGAIERLVKGGIPLGVLPEQTYQAGSLTFYPQDALVLFSDAVVELLPGAGNDPQILANLFDQATDANAMLERMLSLVPVEQGLPDDFTVLVLACQ